MKKFTTLLTMAFIALMSISFTSCDEDSDIAYYKVGDTPVIVDITNTAETAYTIAKAKELIDAGEGLSESVYVKGIVSQASKSLNATYGSLSYYISDDGKD
jgi:ABC-type oligopeptide transport system substrate-binding subunit